MIQCRRDCKREARWEVKGKSWSAPEFVCNLHLVAALRAVTVRQSLTDSPRATVGRL